MNDKNNGQRNTGFVLNAVIMMLLVVIAFGVFGGTAVWDARTRQTPTVDKPVVVYMTERAFAYRLPDVTMIRHRYQDGKARVYRPAHPFYQRLLTGGK